MRIDEAKRKISGFEYMLNRLDIRSGVGRESLSGQPWFAPGQEDALQVELQRVERLRAFIGEGKTAVVEKLQLKFSQVLDIRGTFALLEKEAVDDVQLFELKRFSLLVREAAAYVKELVKVCAFHPAPVGFPDLSAVVSILDPNKEGLPTFYIYDEYDAELARKRKEIRCMEAERQPEDSISETVSRLQAECEEIERRVREILAERLRPHLCALKEAMQCVAYWDLLLAKAVLAHETVLVPPVLQKNVWNENTQPRLRYKGLFNPMVKQALESSHHRYQVVDIALQKGTCLLTGANMSGKTVLLKSLALSQCLLQFGFPIPAEEATLFLFDGIELLVQDEQNETRGLSSFGAEMQRLNTVLESLRQGARLLLFIDELARTTNPDEGKAIVSAVLECLENASCVSMVSTHYGSIPNPVRRLRIRGFREDWNTVAAENGREKNAKKFDISRIQACMDYSVEEETAQGRPPAEALRIARLLGFDAEVLERAEKYYGTSEKNNKA